MITGSWFSVQISYFFLRRGNVFLMQLTVILFVKDFVGGVMVNMFALKAVDRVFDPWSSQTKD